MSKEAVIVVLRAEERLDAANVQDFKDEAMALLFGASGLVVDFSATMFIDSIGLGTLISLLKTCAQRQVRIGLAALPAPLQQVFKLTRLYRLFSIYETVDQARAALAAEAEPKAAES